MIGYTLCTKHTYEMYKQSCCIHLCLCSSPVSHDICRIDNIVIHPYKLQLSITEFEKNYVSIIINVFTEIEEKDLYDLLQVPVPVHLVLMSTLAISSKSSFWYTFCETLLISLTFRLEIYFLNGLVPPSAGFIYIKCLQLHVLCLIIEVALIIPLRHDSYCTSPRADMSN